MTSPRVEALPDGGPVRTFTIGRPGGLLAEIMDYGCTLRRLTVPGGAGSIDVIPSYPDLAGYVVGKAYLNAMIGRFANRLDHGRFSVAGETRRISVNEAPNTLHGGVKGFDRRVWRVTEADIDHVAFAYVSPDGEEGFAGRLDVTAELTLSEDTLTIAYTAVTDRPTPVNLTHHLYFNLSGRSGQTILDHRLKIIGDALTLVREDLIPTGELRSVAATPFDFREAKAVRAAAMADDPQIAIAGGIDHNWALSPANGPQVELHSRESGLTLEIATDQPGLQVYSGQAMPAPFVKFGAIAFEPQGFPDAPNHPNFPDSVLHPGQTYRRSSTYRFRR